MKLKTLILGIVVLIVGASVVTVVGSVSYRLNTMEDVVERTAPMDLRQHLYVTVTTDKNQYYVGEMVKVTIDVTNIGGENVTVYFHDTQTADFKVFDGDGNLIYLWSYDKDFLQVITPLTIHAGQTINIFTDYWEQVDFNGDQVPCGEYRIDGFMVWYYDENYNTYPELHGSIVYITIRESLHDVGVKEITQPTGSDEPWPTGIYPVEAVVKNYGTVIEDFNVTARIWELSEFIYTLYYEDTVQISEINPDDEITVVFENVTFEDPPPLMTIGWYNTTYLLEIYTELEGDENAENNRKTINFTIEYYYQPQLIIDINGTLGDNGWYVSDVIITMYVDDPYEGYIIMIMYRLNIGEWQEYLEPVVVSEDGEHDIEAYWIDSEGNQGDVVGPFGFRIDQTNPTIDLMIEQIGFKKYIIKAYVSDETSGISRVEFYFDNMLIETVTEEPYEYEFSAICLSHSLEAVAYDNAGNYKISNTPPQDTSTRVFGIIYNPEFNEDTVSFFAIAVFYRVPHSFYPVPLLFRQLTFYTIHSTYSGYISNHFICAVFPYGPW